MAPTVPKVGLKESSLKATKQIKQLLKKGKWTESSAISKKATKKSKAPAPKRGLIYIGRIPHGFYEKELKQYFSQFGRVTRVRVNRSEKTGRSKSFGYVEFAEPKVAEIAAETMNNYLMFKKILKVENIPPTKQDKIIFTRQSWSETNHPRKKNRSKKIKELNTNQSVLKLPALVQRAEKNMNKLKDKLKKIGVDFDFKLSDNPFKPLPDCKMELDEIKDDDSVATESDDDEIEINIPYISNKHVKTSDKIKAKGKNMLRKTKGGIEKSSKKIVKISKRKNEAVKENIKEILNSENVVKSFKKVKYQSKTNSTPLMKKSKK